MAEARLSVVQASGSSTFDPRLLSMPVGDQFQVALNFTLPDGVPLIYEVELTEVLPNYLQ